jgi:hydrogenase maturation protease
MIRVVGIGSPFGDDRAGLEVARRVAAQSLAGVEVVRLDRPGVDLLAQLEGADAVLLIDAARGAARPGRVRDFDLRAAPRAGLALVSSHAIGVLEVLALARALERLPARGRLLSIEAAAGGAAAGLSPAVAGGVAAAVVRVYAWIDRFQHEGAGGAGCPAAAEGEYGEVRSRSGVR